jgi:putative transposase
MIACQELSEDAGTVAACNALDIARPTYYRRFDAYKEKASTRPAPPRALSTNERQEILDMLHAERFVDKAPAEVYATLLDEGVYYWACMKQADPGLCPQSGHIRVKRPGEGDALR